MVCAACKGRPTDEECGPAGLFSVRSKSTGRPRAGYTYQVVYSFVASVEVIASCRRPVILQSEPSFIVFMLPPIGGIGATCPPIVPRVASSIPLGQGDGEVADRRFGLRHCHLACQQPPLEVLNLYHLRLQVVHGHLPLSLAVDVRRWAPSISAMGDTLSMYDSVAMGIRLLQKSLRTSVCAKVMMLGMRASVSEKLGPTSSERNVQKRTVRFATRISYVTGVGPLPHLTWLSG